MNLNDVHRGMARRRRRRRGRGTGSGRGKTCGRGHKGQLSRAGASFPVAFQGGTMPLVRRVPKRGFHNRWGRTVAILNVGDLESRFDAGDDVTPQSLRQRRLARGRYDELKILGQGDLNKKLTVHAHRFSKTAREKIEQVGGTAIVLPARSDAAAGPGDTPPAPE